MFILRFISLIGITPVKWMGDLLKALFYSKGKLNPPYMWITLFLIPTVALLWLKVVDVILAYRTTGRLDIPIELLSVVLGFVIIWVGVYNWDRKNTRVHTNEPGPGPGGAQ